MSELEDLLKMRRAKEMEQLTPPLAFLVDQAVLICNEGSDLCKLTVLDESNLASEKPKAKETDCVVDTNICSPYFGNCKKTKEKCKPEIVGKWMRTKSDSIIGEFPAVILISMLSCAKVGLITPATSGQGMVNPNSVENALELLRNRLAGITKIKSIYNLDQVLEKMFINEKNIENAAKANGVPAAIIASILFRELICIGIEDLAVDLAVLKKIKTDASTGVGQIFSGTALKAQNFLEKYYAGEYSGYSGDDLKNAWNEMSFSNEEYENTFKSLQNDAANIDFLAKVLLAEAIQEGYDINSGNPDEVAHIMSLYNSGNASGITGYGAETYMYYEIFKEIY